MLLDGVAVSTLYADETQLLHTVAHGLPEIVERAIRIIIERQAERCYQLIRRKGQLHLSRDAWNDLRQSTALALPPVPVNVAGVNARKIQETVAAPLACLFSSKGL